MLSLVPNHIVLRVLDSHSLHIEQDSPSISLLGNIYCSPISNKSCCCQYYYRLRNT